MTLLCTGQVPLCFPRETQVAHMCTIFTLYVLYGFFFIRKCVPPTKSVVPRLNTKVGSWVLQEEPWATIGVVRCTHGDREFVLGAHDVAFGTRSRELNDCLVLDDHCYRIRNCVLFGLVPY